MRLLKLRHGIPPAQGKGASNERQLFFESEKEWSLAAHPLLRYWIMRSLLADVAGDHLGGDDPRFRQKAETAPLAFQLCSAS
jgi:hypothetical protein